MQRLSLVYQMTMAKKQQSLKQFLREKLYLHPRVKAMTDNAQDVIQSLFAKLMQNPHLLNNNDNLDENELAIIVSDYIAGYDRPLCAANL